MAYVVYCGCDKCGEDAISYLNVSVSLSCMQKIARMQGWSVGKNGWICPNCKSKGSTRYGRREAD